MTAGTAEAGFFSGQSFAIPVEGATQYGDLINKNFGTVTAAIWGSNLMKAGFFLVLFFTIVKIGFRVGGSLQDAGAYLLTVLLLIAPLFNGKSLLLYSADVSDNLTVKICDGLGGLNWQFAGSAVASMMANRYLTDRVLDKYKNELYAFRTNCYNQYTAQLGANAQKPAAFSADYGQMATDGGSVSVIPTGADTLDMSSKPCNQAKQDLADAMKAEFNGYLRDYTDDLNHNLGANGLNPSDQQFLNNLQNVGGDDLFNKGVDTYTTNPVNQNEPGLWESIRRLFTSQGMMSFLMLIPRLMIALAGIFWVYVFNYYIFQIVTVIKMVAAIGMALSILYFMFLRRLELPLAALGVWIYGNGWYIIAAIAMNQYYKAVQASTSPVTQLIFGSQGAVNNGLFAIGIIGLAASAFAVVLSWKGISIAMHHMPGVSVAAGGVKPSPGGGGSKGSSGGGKK